MSNWLIDCEKNTTIVNETNNNYCSVCLWLSVEMEIYRREGHRLALIDLSRQ